MEPVYTYTCTQGTDGAAPELPVKNEYRPLLKNTPLTGNGPAESGPVAVYVLIFKHQCFCHPVGPGHAVFKNIFRGI